MGDLIDDNPIEEDDSSSGSDNEKSGGTKRKRDDDDDELDDRLSEEDFELIEENLGIKMKVQLSYLTILPLSLLFIVPKICQTTNSPHLYRGKKPLSESNEL